MYRPFLWHHCIPYLCFAPSIIYSFNTNHQTGNGWTILFVNFVIYIVYILQVFPKILFFECATFESTINMGNTIFVTYTLKAFYQVWNSHTWGKAGKNVLSCSTPMPFIPILTCKPLSCSLAEISKWNKWNTGVNIFYGKCVVGIVLYCLYGIVFMILHN